MLTSKNVLEKKFSASFRGYDMHQVDFFLDEVKVQLEKYENDMPKLDRKANALENEMNSEGYLSKVNQANDIVEKAKNAYDKYIEDAKKEAQIIVENATKKAKEIVTQKEYNPQLYSYDAQKKQEVGYNNSASIDEQAIKARIKMEYKLKLKKYIDDVEKKAEEIYGNAKAKAAEIEESANEKAVNIKADAETIMEKANAMKAEAEAMLQEANEMKDNAKVEAQAIMQKEMQEHNDIISGLKAQEQEMNTKLSKADVEARSIVEKAQAKADDTEKMMNIMISNSKQRLQEIETKTNEYKSKFQSIVAQQKQFFASFMDESESDIAAKDIAAKVDENIEPQRDIDLELENKIEQQDTTADDESTMEEACEKEEEIVNTNVNTVEVNPVVDFVEINEDDNKSEASFSIDDDERKKLIDAIDDIL